MAGGIGVFQHNTGIFLNSGAVLNYAFTTKIASEFEIAAGLNLFGYQRELADDRSAVGWRAGRVGRLWCDLSDFHRGLPAAA